MRSAAFVAVLFALSEGTASAHIRLLDPAPRHDMLKSGPCGAGADDQRGDIVSTFAPGSTITLRWQETVPHPGYYRISFDPEGQDDFVDPPAPGVPSDDPSVLVDNIDDKPGTDVYEQEITLPDLPCERCTLQLVQVMTDKAPYGDGNDLYYQCADLVLSDQAPATSGTPSPGGGGEGVDDDACACRSAGSISTGLGLFVLLLLRRRPR